MAAEPKTRTTFGDVAYLTLQEAADCLRVDSKSVRRYIASGVLPAYKLGPEPTGKLRDVRPIRIPVGAVDALLHPIVGSAA